MTADELVDHAAIFDRAKRKHGEVLRLVEGARLVLFRMPSMAEMLGMDAANKSPTSSSEAAFARFVRRAIVHPLAVDDTMAWLEGIGAIESVCLQLVRWMGGDIPSPFLAELAALPVSNDDASRSPQSSTIHAGSRNRGGTSRSPSRGAE